MATDKYKVFLEAIDVGSFSGAAEKLGYTPSGVVHMMNSLEKEFGFPLFQRSNKGVTLTPDGERIVPVLRDMMRCEEQLYQVSSEIRGVIVGDITIGSYFSIAASWLPGVICRFQKDYPNVGIKIIEGVHQKLDQLLCEQLADFCLFSYPPDGECQWIPLKRDRMVAVLASGHPMAKLSSFPIVSFRDEPFIMPADGYDYDSMKVLNRHGINPSISYSTGEDHAAIAMIAAGLGIGLFNELATSGRTANTVLLPLDPPEYAELGVAYPASRILSPATKRFIKYLKVYVSEA